MGQTAATEYDLQHLRRAIDLAGEAYGATSPNPAVGAVVVKGGRTIGEGFHTGAGHPHAERVALESCAEKPAGSTLYISLEPCCHEGLTPPCTDAILEAGVARVVVASDDPSPKAAGRGLGILRDEGVEVDVMDEELGRRARLLNQPFRKHARTGRPFVIFKAATTLDGKVATSTGDSRWISGEASRARAHRWRAQCDAVAVGIGTAMQDDPLLTARIEAVTRQPRRVVFDSEASLPVTGRLVRSLDESPVILVCSRAAKRPAVEALEVAGVDVIVATGANEPARIESALDQLGERDVQSLLLEGGPHLAGAFFDASEIDEARVFIAPKLIGGQQGRAPIDGRGVELMSEVREALATEVERIDDDVLITASFKEW